MSHEENFKMFLIYLWINGFIFEKLLCVNRKKCFLFSLIKHLLRNFVFRTIEIYLYYCSQSMEKLRIIIYITLCSRDCNLDKHCTILCNLNDSCDVNCSIFF